MARKKTSGSAKRGNDVETRIGWRMAGIGMETASYVLGGVFLGWLAKEGFGGGDGWIVGGGIVGDCHWDFPDASKRIETEPPAGAGNRSWGWGTTH